VAQQSKISEREIPFAVEQALIGDHPAIAKLRALIERVAPTEVTVLLTGESGTGKEVVANAIHTLSLRSNQPFVPVNCAAIPHDLLESEMFGHERGAFTGAAGSRHGLLTTADRGTIFLDEIGEMPKGLQAKLLRVLEDGVVRAVGADRANRVDVRVIAASNVDLAASVAKGTFREDLFYRLQVVPIVIAPLRERRSDVPLLTEHFLQRIRDRQPRRELAISREAMVALWSYDWPGNVRELENAIERAVALGSGPIVHVGDLPSHLHYPTSERVPDKDELLPMEELERRAILRTLRETNGDKLAAARMLGIGKTTLYRKLKQYQLEQAQA
jgi:transcriptional regulator with PAS, ATPase and Fis domain